MKKEEIRNAKSFDELLDIKYGKKPIATTSAAGVSNLFFYFRFSSKFSFQK